MNQYSRKEMDIIKQCTEGPFHTLVTNLTNEEFNELVTKLISDDNYKILPSLVAIYTDYNRNQIIDYFIKKKDPELLLGFLDYCHDFSTPNNILDQKYVVDKLLDTNDKELIENIMNSNSLYFLTNQKEKERLLNYLKG